MKTILNPIFLSALYGTEPIRYLRDFFFLFSKRPFFRQKHCSHIHLINYFYNVQADLCPEALEP